MSTIGELRAELAALLRSKYPADRADFDALYILSELTGLNHSELLLNADRSVDVFAAAIDAVQRRLCDEPLQYIFSRAYFMDLTLYVTPSVLIPRPETELLAEWVVKRAPLGGRVLDVGTGSGAIALAVAATRPDLEVTAVDKSAAALAVARKNLLTCGLSNVTMLESDLFSALAGQKFDLIAANLPYVSASEYAECPAEVRLFEPHNALVAADSGLALMRAAIAASPGVLVQGGAIILEMGETQGEAVSSMLAVAGFTEVGILKDYTGRERFAVATMPVCPSA